MTYLLHQSRQLHKLHDGPLDLIIDTVPTEGFYDEKRLRCHGEGLYRAYELLYPRDTYTISPEVLEVAGQRGIAALWCDKGRIRGDRYEISFGTKAREYREGTMLRHQLRKLGYKPDPGSCMVRDKIIGFTGARGEHFASRVRQYIPRHRHHTLRR